MFLDIEGMLVATLQHANRSIFNSHVEVVGCEQPLLIVLQVGRDKIATPFQIESLRFTVMLR
jgi:hypothetical protein